MSAHEEAKCPECGEWGRVAPTGPYVVPVDAGPIGDVVTGLSHGPWWWAGADGNASTGPAGCPKCDAIVMVESECDFRKVATP
jgi:endogenous inhibitor of DNA gyrase (YacG/DUF329 family)